MAKQPHIRYSKFQTLKNISNSSEDLISDEPEAAQKNQSQS